jgi:hypothetical protein
MKGIFNFGRRTTKKFLDTNNNNNTSINDNRKLSRRLTKSSLNNLSIQKKEKKENTSRLSFMSSMTDQQKEEPLEVRKERLLENIIKSFNTNDKSNKNDLTNYAIENNQNDIDFLSQIESTNSTLESFKFTSPKEEGEKSQLVERSILDKYREENSHNEEQIKKLNLNITDMKNKLFKSTGENNFIKQGTEFQNKQKSDNAKQIIFLQDLLEECKTLNKNLKDNLTEKKIQKDALFNALYNYMKKYDENMAIEMKSIINCYNKQLYMMNNKGVDEKYIDSLFSQIKIKEKLLTSKNKEIKELERFLFVPVKEKKGKNKKNARNSVNAVNKNVK